MFSVRQDINNCMAGSNVDKVKGRVGPRVPIPIYRSTLYSVKKTAGPAITCTWSEIPLWHANYTNSFRTKNLTLIWFADISQLD